MIRLTTIAILCLGLAGCNGSSADINHVIDVLSGNSAPQQQAFLAIPEPPEEQASSSEAAPSCVPGTATTMWRYMVYDACTGEYLYTME